MCDLPDVIREVGFDFSWDEAKVWALEIPVTDVGMEVLEWHFDVPFLWHAGGRYNLTPREVMERPDLFPEELRRIAKSDPSYPLDVMENRGRLVMLDGLHRLMKARMEGRKTIRVRVVPRNRIRDIRR